MEPRSRTQFWAGPKLPAASWPVAPLGRCPVCNADTTGRPYCLRDGTLTASGPFLVGGRYLVEESLGSGGLSLVFGARHQFLGKPVAVKILRHAAAADPTHVQRFMREARLASQLHHDNIIDISDFGHDEALDASYLVMTRLHGHTLAEELSQTGALHYTRVVPILIQLCRALAIAHGENVLHRDVNPSNVFLTRASGQNDIVKLCDFGLSRLSSGEDRVTSTGAFLGTPAYMAPEQIRGDEVQDARVDLYGLGVTAYEMLTGKLPYAATNPVALVTSKLTDEAAPFSVRAPLLSVPPALEALIMRCLARDPAARPESAIEIDALLSEINLSASVSKAVGPSALVGQMVGSYRIVSLIGSGGSGSVYLGEHPVIGTKVAVKVLRPEVMAIPGVVERFIQEARAAGQIGNPHLPRYFDFGTLSGGQPFAVMEHLVGETVAARLQRALFSVEEAQSLLEQVGGALTQAHAAGIIHRDIKPENLFLTIGADGKTLVKVLDFGIAKLMAAPTEGRLTQMGVALGTPCYAAPEQLLGGEVGPSADVYALGATVFEVLTGSTPFDGTLSDVVQAKIARDAPRIESLRRELPAALSQTVAKMLARNPAHRFETMDAVLESVRSWRDKSESQLVIETELLERVPRSRRSAWLVAAVVAIALVGSGLALVLHRAAPVATTTPPVAPPVEAKVVSPVETKVAPPVVSDTAQRPIIVAPKLQPKLPSGWRDPYADGQQRKEAPKKPKKPSKGDLVIADPFAE